MQAARPGKLQSAINVTPLVDVVLVLLIIFMVIAPQLHSGPAVRLPATERPSLTAGENQRIVVAIERDGTLWIDGEQVSAERFPDRLRQAAIERSHGQVVIQGDAGLSFGAVKRTMLAVEAAGFADVGLVAERHEARGR